ncbi:Hypothetical protein A7982_00482 [Minicystis rosea]|nr:Hypothetical protein A7982_00482 [Minicystis rosea]
MRRHETPVDDHAEINPYRAGEHMLPIGHGSLFGRHDPALNQLFEQRVVPRNLHERASPE